MKIKKPLQTLWVGIILYFSLLGVLRIAETPELLEFSTWKKSWSRGGKNFNRAWKKSFPPEEKTDKTTP